MNPYRTQTQTHTQTQQDTTTSSSSHGLNSTHSHSYAHPQHLPHHLTRLDNDSATHSPTPVVTNGTNDTTTATNPTSFTEKHQQEMAPPAPRQQMHNVYEHPYQHMNAHQVYQPHPLAQPAPQHQHGNLPGAAAMYGYNHPMSLPSSPPPAYMPQDHQHAVQQHYALPAYDEHGYAPQWQGHMRGMPMAAPQQTYTATPVAAATAAATGQNVLASSPPSYRHSNGMVHQHSSSGEQAYWNTHLPPHLQSQQLSSPQQLVPSQHGPIQQMGPPFPSMISDNVERGFPFYTSEFDQTGQTPPPGFDMNELKNVKGSLWEDLGTVAWSKEVNESCVARRDCDNYINGTKLLNVTKMTRGRRDGLLKNEKDRVVVRIGPMHLKGVWIPLDRALHLANREQITPALYPLFCKNIKDILEPVLAQQAAQENVGSPTSTESQHNQVQNQVPSQPVQVPHGHAHQSSGSSASNLPSLTHSVIGTPIRTPPRGPRRSPPSAGVSSIVHSSGGTYYGQQMNGHGHHNGYASHAQHAQAHGYNVLGPAPGNGVGKKTKRRQSGQVHIQGSSPQQNGNGYARYE